MMSCFGCFGRPSRPELYQGRLQNRQIRVLEILPGQPDDPIRCRLAEKELDNAQFEALSYVWSDPKNTIDVQCNGHNMPITVNLGDALRRLRLLSESRFVWADAICINQQDLVERSHQVQLMRDIYTLAMPVTVWLGHGNPGSPELVKELLVKLDVWRKELHKSGFYNWPTIKPYPTTDGSEANKQVHGDEKMWRALGELLSAPWFSRIWCVQEVVLARGVSLLFGDVQIDWNEIACLAWELDRKDPGSDLHAPDFVKALEYSKGYSMATTEAEAQSLEHTLHSFRGWQATDARDKVYGVLGLVDRSQWEPDIRIDYTRPAAELYKEVATSSLERHESLAILSFVGHGPIFDANTVSSPSWVPQWTTKKANMSIVRDPLNPHWSACGRHTTPKKSTVDCSCLVLDGALVDTVISTGPIMDSSILSAASPSKTTHPFLSLWKALLPDDSVPATSRQTVIRLCHTLALGLDITMECDLSDCEPEDLEEQERFSRDFLPYIKSLYELAGEVPPGLQALNDGIPGNWENFSSLATQVTIGYRIFYTEAGRYGIGPACMEKGDVVALLWGGSVPYVLRRSTAENICSQDEKSHKDGSGQFYYLAECYVDELMSGDFADSEAIECEIILV